MKDCPSCGTENRDQAIYCRKCGEKMSQSIYVKPKESFGVIHIGVLLLSVILLITSFGLLMGGTTLRSIQSLVVDEDGYITSDPATIDLPGYAIVLEDIEFDVDPMAWKWIQGRGGLLKLKIITESNDPGFFGNWIRLSMDEIEKGGYDVNIEESYMNVIIAENPSTQ